MTTFIPGGYAHGTALIIGTNTRTAQANPARYVILRPNNISGRDDFFRRPNSNSLANYIRGRLVIAGYYNPNTINKFRQMVNHIINTRRREQNGGVRRVNELYQRTVQINRTMANLAQRPNFYSQGELQRLSRVRNTVARQYMNARARHLKTYKNHQNQINAWNRLKRNVIPRI